jgi:hypothetical protein
MAQVAGPDHMPRMGVDHRFRNCGHEATINDGLGCYDSYCTSESLPSLSQSQFALLECSRDKHRRRSTQSVSKFKADLATNKLNKAHQVLAQLRAHVSKLIAEDALDLQERHKRLVLKLHHRLTREM